MFNEPFHLKNIHDQINELLLGIYDTNEANSITKVLLESKVQDLRVKLISQPELLINEEALVFLFEKLIELKSNRPIQYVLGETEFMGLNFLVDENVLIPRPETEELVTWILEEDLSDKSILDIGTGSGCIPIAIAKSAKGSSKISALDFSETALKVARQNAKLNNVAIEFINANILEKINLNSVYDIIVSNPPYVTHSEKPQMSKNVLDFEPDMALFVDDHDPLLFYKSIINFCESHLTRTGLLFFEINENFGNEIVELLISKNFKDIELRKDLSGKDRMIRAQKIL